jgi:hypothetical protein
LKTIDCPSNKQKAFSQKVFWISIGIALFVALVLQFSGIDVFHHPFLFSLAAIAAGIVTFLIVQLKRP